MPPKLDRAALATNWATGQPPEPGPEPTAPTTAPATAQASAPTTAPATAQASAPTATAEAQGQRPPGGVYEGRTAGGRRRVVTYLTDAEHDALAQLAEANGATVAGMIRALVRQATAGPR